MFFTRSTASAVIASTADQRIKLDKTHPRRNADDKTDFFNFSSKTISEVDYDNYVQRKRIGISNPALQNVMDAIAAAPAWAPLVKYVGVVPVETDETIADEEVCIMRTYILFKLYDNLIG